MADDLDLEFCARSFELSGGNIRSAAITAAYLAAEAGGAGHDGGADRGGRSRSTASSAGWSLEREFGPYLVRN